MAFLTDQLPGSAGSSRRRGPDAGDVLRRLARGRRAARACRWGLAALAGAGLICGALALAAGLLAAARPVSGAESGEGAPPTWTEVKRPLPLYDLAGSDFARLPMTYEARRRVPDGAREDVLSFGALGDGRPYLRIVLARRGTAAAPETVPLADALARIAARAADTATEVRPLPATETRFGPLERAEFTLFHAGARTACQGFRGRPDDAVLSLSGFACASADRPLDEGAVACAVDRVDLLSAGDDEALRALFVTIERRAGRAGCREGILATRLAPAVADGPFAEQRRRAAWLDARPDGWPLRGPLGSTDDEP